MKRWNRSSLGIFLLAIGIVLPCIAFFVLHLFSPSDGTRLQPGQEVWGNQGVLLTPLQENSPLRSGDLLISINGKPLDTLAQDLFPSTHQVLGLDADWQAGQEVTYTVIRNGRQLEIPVKLGTFPLLSVLGQSWGTLSLSLVVEFLAIFVFLHRPEETVARTFLLSSSGLLGAMSWSFGLQTSDLVNSLGFWLYQVTTYGAYQIFWMAGLHFTLDFAYPHFKSSKRLWLIWLIYLVSAAFCPLNLALTWFGSASTLAWIGRWTPGQGALSLVYLVFIIIVIIRGYRTSQNALLRQKIRWVTFVAALCGTGSLLLWTLPTDVLGHPIISVNVLGLLIFPFPISLVVAILRHRLFDIDVIIHRTLVYGTLTSLLALIYVGLVLTLQTFMSVFGKQAAQSPPIIVVSTLIIAALFQPLRGYIQRIIDRRFYRSKYDAARTLAAFSATLYSEVELNQLSQRLLAVVQETMQPTYLSLWIRPAEQQSKSQNSDLQTTSEPEV